MTKPSQITLLFCALSFLITPTHSSEFDEIVANTVSRFIQPGYSHLALQTKRLEHSAIEFCQNPNKNSLKHLRQEFQDAVLSWAHIESVRFGPIVENNYLERIHFWPDPKGIGRRQLSKMLKKAGGDNPANVWSLKKIQSKSVALQGFDALEYVLFSNLDSGLTVDDPKHKHHCQYILIVSKSLAEITQTLNRKWQNKSAQAITQLLNSPSENNPLYRTQKEALLQVFKTLDQGLRIISDLKLKRVLHKSFEHSKAKRAPFWRSQMTLPVITTNLKTMRALFVDSGFSNLLGNHEPGAEKSLLLDFDRAIKTSQDIQHPLVESLKNAGQYKLLQYLKTSVTNIQISISRQVTEAADLPLNFNALDGD